MLHLRGHHLLCVLTYIGRGYSPAFVLTMDKVVAALAKGAPFQLVQGPDDLCAPLQAEQHDCAAHCHTDRTRQRDILALEAVGDVLARQLKPGEVLTLAPDTIALMRQHFATKPDFRKACTGCEWHDLCSDIAAGGYQGCKL